MLALIGLALAPLATPTAAAPTGSAASMEMAGDMPCCPAGKPMMPDCAKACPLITLCLSKAFQISGNSTPVPAFSLAAIILPGDQAMPEGLAQPPPARPPRSVS